MAYTFKHGDRPVDGYTIQRAVGKGGFGEVYYAISDGGREVALKYLRDNPQIELRGVANCINLKSPHLVSIFDVKKTTDGEYTIVMEYCSGPSLRDLLIAEPHGFEPQKAAFFLREIGKGLAYLHDSGIVHRDLKPGNIFYDDGYVKIGDYGLSKFISISRHSAQTASVGTVHYMAPEIGSGNYSRGVDIYALGVMLYEMLLGKVPFEGSSMAEVLMKHLTTQPELDELPHPFGKVIRKALQKDPKDRYQTVDEMISELMDEETIRESVAGFRPHSLGAAVAHHAGDPLDSPMPSPNPARGFGPGFAEPVRGDVPYAEPIGQANVSFPDRLSRRMDRVSKKMDAKMAKLAGHPAPRDPLGRRTRRAARKAHREALAAQRKADAPQGSGVRKKRMLLSGLLSVGLAIGLGLLVGETAERRGDQYGASAGMMVIAMAVAVLLSQRAIGWFGVLHGPNWAQHFVRLGCATPLLAVGAAPALDADTHYGMPIWLGLLAVATFANWNKAFDRDKPGELGFGSAIWTAFGAAICTGIIHAMMNGRHDEVAFVAAGIAGTAALIVQASGWWLCSGTPPVGAMATAESGDAPDGYGSPPPPPPPVEAAQAYASPVVPAQPLTPSASGPPQPKLRWGITRAFFGLLAFALMGGAITTMFYASIVERTGNQSKAAYHHDMTFVVILCIACASFMIFAFRRIGPVKRDGFWRETLNPLLMSVCLFGVGGTITGMAREWPHKVPHEVRFEQAGTSVGPVEKVRCVDDEVRVALLVGLIFSSMGLFGLLATGGRRRQPKPFVQMGSGPGIPGGFDPDENAGSNTGGGAATPARAATPVEPHDPSNLT